MMEMEMDRSLHKIHVVQLPGEQARDRQIGKPVLTKHNGIPLRRRCEAGKMRKVNDVVSTKGKVSSHRSRWPSLLGMEVVNAEEHTTF